MYSHVNTMFSIIDDEALQLRNHERRVVEYVESVLLDSSVQIMAMQVQCTAPDCVPIETVVLILFPRDNEESGKKLIDSQAELTESKDGSSIQFKILKPISEVTKEDVETSLPFSLRSDSLAATGLHIRNDLFTQLEKRFPSEEDPQSRQWMVQFLQESLQQYVDNGCQRPDDWKEEESNLPFHGKGVTSNKTIESKIAPLGNITFRRPIDEDSDKVRWLPFRHFEPCPLYFTFCSLISDHYRHFFDPKE